jgi:phenylacetate-CoA ligase
MALALQWQLARTERLPPSVLRAQQMRQVAALMVQAATIPFWRDRLRSAGLSPGVPPEEDAWARLPVLTRPEVQHAGPSLFASLVPVSHGTLRHLATSGSTGHPVTIRSTGLGHFFWNGFLLREALWHGFDFAATMVTITRNPEPSANGPLGTAMPEGVVRPDWGMPFSPLFATGPAAALDNRLSVAEQYAWLRRQASGYLHAKPATLHDLARHCLEHGITIPSLRAVRSFAAPVTSALRGLCRDAWGVEVISAYSTEEAGYLALQCPQHPHYHVQSEGVLLEVLRDDGSACAIGETGRVVVTPLHNLAMPLLRYELGDYAEVGPPCPCGRTLPVLKRIVGRARSRLRMPDGQRRFPDNPALDFAAIPTIRRYQIAQVAGDLVEVRMVVTVPLTTAQEAALTEALAVSLGHRFPLRFVALPELPGGPGGKFLDIICELPAADAA